MILQNLDLLSSDPAGFVRLILTVIFGLVIAITVHEFSHAYIAFRLGDDTAHNQGRLSLNPFVHLDPMGTLLIFIAGFGWGKPVPVNTSLLRQPVRRSMAAVSVAGILANLLIATVIALPFRFIDFPDEVLINLVIYTVQINIVLAFFNLLPFPPLDGFNLLSAALPERVMLPLAPVLRWAPFMLLAVLVIDNFLPVSILGTVIGWPVNHVTGALLGLG